MMKYYSIPYSGRDDQSTKEDSYLNNYLQTTLKQQKGVTKNFLHIDFDPTWGFTKDGQTGEEDFVKIGAGNHLEVEIDDSGLIQLRRIKENGSSVILQVNSEEYKLMINRIEEYMQSEYGTRDTELLYVWEIEAYSIAPRIDSLDREMTKKYFKKYLTVINRMVGFFLEKKQIARFLSPDMDRMVSKKGYVPLFVESRFDPEGLNDLKKNFVDSINKKEGVDIFNVDSIINKGISLDNPRKVRVNSRVGKGNGFLALDSAYWVLVKQIGLNRWEAPIV